MEVEPLKPTAASFPVPASGRVKRSTARPSTTADVALEIARAAASASGGLEKASKMLLFGESE